MGLFLVHAEFFYPKLSEQYNNLQVVKIFRGCHRMDIVG